MYVSSWSCTELAFTPSVLHWACLYSIYILCYICVRIYMYIYVWWYLLWYVGVLFVALSLPSYIRVLVPLLLYMCVLCLYIHTSWYLLCHIYLPSSCCTELAFICICMCLGTSSMCVHSLYILMSWYLLCHIYLSSFYCTELALIYMKACLGVSLLFLLPWACLYCCIYIAYVTSVFSLTFVMYVSLSWCTQFACTCWRWRWLLRRARLLRYVSVWSLKLLVYEALSY